MMTKKEFAEQIVCEFCENEGIERKDAHSYIFSSSRLAVALEFLGELEGIEKTYAQGRGGTEYRHIILDSEGQFEDVHYITTRDMLKLLPESLEENEITFITNFDEDKLKIFSRAIKEWESKKKSDSRKLLIKEGTNKYYKYALYLSVLSSEACNDLDDFWNIYNKICHKENDE